MLIKCLMFVRNFFESNRKQNLLQTTLYDLRRHVKLALLLPFNPNVKVQHAH